MNERIRYTLNLKEEKYRNETHCSFYFVKTNKKEKTSCPYNHNGVRMKLDLLTGELRNYTRKECELNAYNSIERTKKLLNMLLDMNDFDWFCTLTFDNERIKRTCDEDVYSAYVKFINNIKHKFPTLKYITVLERHEDKNIHFHMVIGGVPWQKLGLENSGKVCCHWAKKKDKYGILRNVKCCSPDYFEKTKHLHELKDTDGLPIYNITNFIYGFTTATRIASRERCNSYIKKYVEKALGSTDVFKKRFYYSENLNVPDIVKRCIGADFTTPEDIYKIVKTNDIFNNAYTSCFLDKYNIAMCRIDNNIKSNIDKGLIPTTEKTPFD